MSSDRHHWGDLEAEYVPSCDWCDDDTDAVIGVPVGLAAALEDDRGPEAEVSLCVGHARMLHQDIATVLNQLAEAVRPD